MVIMAVVLLLLGPDKLPEVAQKLGSWWRAIKSLQERVEAEVRQAIPDLPSTSDIARIARSPVNLLNQLADRVDAPDTPNAPAHEDTTTLNETLIQPPRPPRISRDDSPTPPPDPSMN